MADSRSLFDVLAHPAMPMEVSDKLLRVAGLPKANFLSRVGLPGEYSEALASFDADAAATARSCLGLPADAHLSARSASALAAPQRHGGLGYVTAQAVSCAAFVGAIANASYALLHAFPAALPPIMGAAILTAFQDIHGHVEVSVRQKALPPFAASSREILEFFALPEHRARAHRLQARLRRSVTKMEASAALREAAPLHAAAMLASRATWSALATSLPLGPNRPNNAARFMAMRMRAGLPPGQNMPERCHCGADLTVDPWHPLSHSGGNSEGIMGHNDIVKVLCSEIERAGGKAWTEPRFQLHHADDEHTDIRFSLGGQLIYVDVTVVHPTAATYLARATQGPLRAAASAEAAKNRQYLARAEQEHAQFFPFVVETYGGFGKLARQLVKLISDHASGASALFSPADIRQAIQRGVHHKLQLRNLRLMTAQLNLAHRPPPRRGLPSGPAPTPAAPGTAPRGPPPGQPGPGRPPQPPRDQPRGPPRNSHRNPPQLHPRAQHSRRSQLVVTQDGQRRSTTLTVTAADDSFDQYISSVNDALGLGLVTLGPAGPSDASATQAPATRLSALAEQSLLLASDPIPLPVDIVAASGVVDVSLAPCDASENQPPPIESPGSTRGCSPRLAGACGSAASSGEPSTQHSAQQHAALAAACPLPSAAADVTMASLSPRPVQG